MGLLFRLVEFLIVIVPLVGVIIAAIRAISSASRRRGEAASEASLDNLAVVESRGATIGNQAAQWRAITRVLDEHDRTDARWLEYELDTAKLLDFPVMTDMRDPLTTRFHKAKLRADFHRPLRAEDHLDDRDAARQYFDAVENYVTAFNAAEAEAIRRRRSDFSRDGQQRLRVPRACCVWPQTPPRRRRNVSMHTRWRVPNLTASSCCRKTPEPASSAESSARSTGRSPR